MDNSYQIIQQKYKEIFITHTHKATGEIIIDETQLNHSTYLNEQTLRPLAIFHEHPLTIGCNFHIANYKMLLNCYVSGRSDVKCTSILKIEPIHPDEFYVEQRINELSDQFGRMHFKEDDDQMEID